MNHQCWPERVKAVRGNLILNQPSFASLMGFTTEAVSRWENGSALPSGPRELLLLLLESVQRIQPRDVVLGTLRKIGAKPVHLARVLAWLERQDVLSRPPALLGAPVPVPVPVLAPVDEPHWPGRIKAIREKLGLSPARFAALIGISRKAIRRWEKGLGEPSDLGELFLPLLSRVVDAHPPAAVLAALRNAGPEKLAMLRALTWLEQHPTFPVGAPG